MDFVPTNLARALIICTRPPDYAPTRLREAARYLLDTRDATDRGGAAHRDRSHRMAAEQERRKTCAKNRAGFGTEGAG